MPKSLPLRSTSPAENQAPCTPPTNQPSGLSFSEKTDNSVKVTFTAAAAAAGETPANAYLVVFSSDANPAHAQPVNGQAYTLDAAVGLGQAKHAGAATEVVVKDLVAEATYNVFVYAMATAGNCYNTTSPLTGSITTDKKQTNNPGTDTAKGSSSKLIPLLDFNFVGSNNKWSNLTPIVYYGWTIAGTTSYKKEGKTHRLFGSSLQIGPYVGTTIAIKDSSSYLPALMLPGNAGVQVNYFMTFGNEKKFSVVVSPLNLGLKVVSGFSDSSISLVQHNIRHAVGIRYGDYFTLSAQYTTGWHDLTSQSEVYYKKIFPNVTQKMQYWNVSLTTRLSDDLFGGKSQAPLYLSLNWRSLVNPSKYGNLPNTRFLTVGLITNLDLKSGSNPGLVPKSPGL